LGIVRSEENPSGLGMFEFNLRFPGQYFDRETGLRYNGLRTFDPATGRFLEPDPVGTVLFRNMAFRTLGALGLSKPELAALLYSKQPRYNHLYSYVGSDPLSYDDPLGLIWPWDCYQCFKHRNEFEEALKNCRREYESCKTPEEQIEFIEKYGGGYVSTAIYNCATQKKPDAFKGMIESCGKCGVNPRGRWPTRKPR
jgi:RHS repeat-associated protein